MNPVIQSSILYELLPVTFKDVEGVYKGSISASKGLGRLFYQLAVGFINLCLTRSWTFVLYSALWITGLVGANYADVSTLYICVSIFVTMLMNLSTRGEGELSAYSVFNNNFERLMGTLTAEQFDAEIRHQMPMNNNNNMPILDAEDDDEGGIEEDEQLIDKRTMRVKKRELKLSRDDELKKLQGQAEEADRKYLERLSARQNFIASVHTSAT
ncbi:hypothetical protein EON65_05275 [archaeon]|nr:MAG: hypothetical protein EON65_05275 [archaeon]